MANENSETNNPRRLDPLPLVDVFSTVFSEHHTRFCEDLDSCRVAPDGPPAGLGIFRFCLASVGNAEDLEKIVIAAAQALKRRVDQKPQFVEKKAANYNRFRLREIVKTANEQLQKRDEKPIVVRALDPLLDYQDALDRIPTTHGSTTRSRF